VASEHGVVAQKLWVEQRNDTSDPRTPYEAILRSYRFFFNRDPADLLPAVESLRRVVSSHPECGLAWVQLSRLYSANHAFEVTAVETPIAESLDCAQRGVLLDPTGQRAGGALAWALLLKGELSASRAEALRALDLNPTSLVYLESLAWLLILAGDDERAPSLVRGSIARNPFHLPIAHAAMWCHHFRRGEIDEAYDAALRYRDSGFFWRDLMRSSCLGHLGRLDEAKAEVTALLRARPDFQERGRELIGRMIKLPDLFERVVDGLGRAGLRLS
jgi:adenylate cyclase